MSISKRFEKPKISQLDSYAIELEHPEFDSEAFIDHYDSVGWVIGKNKPMKDWKATVRQWIKRNNPKPKKEDKIPFEFDDYHFSLSNEEQNARYLAVKKWEEDRERRLNR